jgi:hypothetical protein
LSPILPSASAALGKNVKKCERSRGYYPRRSEPPKILHSLDRNYFIIVLDRGLYGGTGMVLLHSTCAYSFIAYGKEFSSAGFMRINEMITFLTWKKLR